jgi:hypothetical protein
MTRPCSRGIKLPRIIKETAIAATESAVFGGTDGITKVIKAAIKTATLLKVSAKIC